MMALGADGVISVVANAFPAQFSAMVKFALKNNFEKARELHFKLLDFYTLLFTEGSPSGIKFVLETLKICQDHLRMPLVPVSKSLQNKLQASIESVD